MSRMPPIQKPLGWAQRFLYAIERGPLPQPQLSLTLDHDWPLDLQMRQANLLTAAGGVTMLSYTPSQENHGLLIYCVQEGASAAFPGTDLVKLRITSPQGLLFDLVSTVGTTIIPLVGGSLKGSTLEWLGIDPVYVPPEWTVEILHTSVAGGVTAQSTMVLLERPRSYPLRLP